MRTRSRVLVTVASLLLLLAYVFPLWTITLEASHLDERLGMVILVDDIVGQEPGHIEEINHLNHYVGMRAVDPDAVPELDIMPWVVAALSLFGLITAALGRRRLLYAWAATLVLVALLGLADFWWWEYQYGHNLDEEEAIFRVPGMSFQPPLIGEKKILNFTVWSWPGLGGAAALLAGLLAVVTAGMEALASRRATPSAPTPSGGSASHGDDRAG